ncbi:metal-independent alpha-mannosidase [archaeon]|nr:MAG: metal-independent alpha-mannosidase [archaeon]
MWLRDSSNQLLPYLPYASSDAALKQLAAGLIARHARSVLIDPYANAFQVRARGTATTRGFARCMQSREGSCMRQQLLLSFFVSPRTCIAVECAARSGPARRRRNVPDRIRGHCCERHAARRV